MFAGSVAGFTMGLSAVCFAEEMQLSKKEPSAPSAKTPKRLGSEPFAVLNSKHFLRKEEPPSDEDDDEDDDEVVAKEEENTNLG
jgi:hypothetical protein